MIISCAQSRLIVFKYTFRLATRGYIAENIGFGQICPQMTPWTPCWVGSKSKNLRKVSEEALYCAQSRFIVFKHRLKVIFQAWNLKTIYFYCVWMGNKWEISAFLKNRKNQPNLYNFLKKLFCPHFQIYQWVWFNFSLSLEIFDTFLQRYCA